MVDGPFEHSDLRTLGQAGMRHAAALGENIAKGDFGIDGNGLVRAWLDSDEHRENLFDARWNATAIGIACGPDGSIYATQQFGELPATATPSAPPIGSSADLSLLCG